MEGHRMRVGALAWSSSLLSSGSRDKIIFQRDIRAQEDSISKLTGHKSEVRFMYFTLSLYLFKCSHFYFGTFCFEFMGKSHFCWTFRAHLLASVERRFHGLPILGLFCRKQCYTDMPFAHFCSATFPRKKKEIFHGRISPMFGAEMFHG